MKDYKILEPYDERGRVSYTTGGVDQRKDMKITSLDEGGYEIYIDGSEIYGIDGFRKIVFGGYAKWCKDQGEVIETLKTITPELFPMRKMSQKKVDYGWGW